MNRQEMEVVFVAKPQTLLMEKTVKEELFGAGTGAALVAVLAALLRGGAWRKFLTAKRLHQIIDVASDNSAPQDADLATTLATAFQSQYEALVEAVVELRKQVATLSGQLAEARHEITDLRNALASAHTEIERLTAALLDK